MTEQNQKKVKLFLFHHDMNLFFLLSVFIIGTVLIACSWAYNIKQTKYEAKQLAMAVEASIPKSSVLELKAEPSDLLLPAYTELKNSLASIKKINQEIRFVYIYTKKKNKIFFAADSEPVGSKGYSPPGQEYPEADKATFLPFQTGKVVITDPSSDRWGTWISVLVPMKSPVTGSVFAVLGFDFPAKSWNQKVLIRTLQTAAIVFCLIIILVAVVFSNLRNKELRALNSKLKKQEILFRTLFEQAPIGIAISTDFEFLQTMNPAFEQISGRKAEPYSFINFDDFIEESNEQLNQLKSGEINFYSGLKQYQKPDNSFVWIYTTVARLQTEKNTETSHIILIENIDALMLAEEALKESERSKSVLLDNLPGMAYRCEYDRNWTMRFVSQGCHELTGYRAESLLNNKEKKFNELISEESQDYLWEKWKEVVSNQEKLKEEYELITATGEKKWVFEQGQGVYDENNQVIALEGLIIDITARKKWETEIKYLNDHDYLTGLYNRRYFESEVIKLDRPENLPLSVIVGDINGVRLINDALGHAAGDQLIIETAKLIQRCCRDSQIISRTGGDDFSILFPNTTRTVAIEIMKNIEDACEAYNQNAKKGPFAIHLSLGCQCKTSAQDDFSKIYKDAEDDMYKNKILDRKSSHHAILSAIMATMLAKSRETEQHAERIANISEKIGIRLGLSQKNLDLLKLFSMLHDIGKIGIDDSILKKPAALDDNEMTAMKKHPEIGYRIAMSSPELEPIAELILTHHERWDGKGYPQGLFGEEIPLLSRILSIADSYDAMTKDRIYRKAFSKQEALAKIKQNAGEQFDPVIVEIFEKII